MDGSFNIEELIVSGVRSRKRNTELPNCPVCSCTVRPGELEAHLALETERLSKVNTTKRKLSSGSGASTSRGATAGPSTEMEEEVDVTGCTGGEVYRRVRSNRLRRLRCRRAPTGECPVCGVRMPRGRLARHAVRCLRRTGAPPADGEYVPDTSSDEDVSIDVENDESEAGGSFGAEYNWCGEWRVRAAALAGARSVDGTPLRRASHDKQLVVDDDEDTELYGPPQYSPSRIDTVTEQPARAEPSPERPAEVNYASAEIADRIVRREGRNRLINGLQESDEEICTEPPIEEPDLTGDTDRLITTREGTHMLVNGSDLLRASCETRIAALTARIKELEAKQKTASENKCLICLSAYTSPAVSIQCWHVYCENCWLESLRAKKLCPQCNAITTASHLRRIYM